MKTGTVVRVPDVVKLLACMTSLILVVDLKKTFWMEGLKEFVEVLLKTISICPESNVKF